MHIMCNMQLRNQNFSVKVVDTQRYWLMISSGNLIPSILYWFALYWLELAAWSMCWRLLESICFYVILCCLRIEEWDVHGRYSYMVGSHFPVVEFQVHFTGNPGSRLFRYPKKISRHEDIGLHKLPPSVLLSVILCVKITKLPRLELVYYVKTQPSSNCCILESVTTSEMAPSSNLYNQSVVSNSAVVGDVHLTLFSCFVVFKISRSFQARWPHQTLGRLWTSA